MLSVLLFKVLILSVKKKLTASRISPFTLITVILDRGQIFFIEVEIALKKKQENVMDQKNCSATHIGFLVFSYHSSLYPNICPLSNMAVITVKGPIGLS